MAKEFKIPKRFLNPSNWDDNKSGLKKYIHNYITKQLEAGVSRKDIRDTLKPFKVGDKQIEITQFNQYLDGKQSSITFYDSANRAKKNAREALLETMGDKTGAATATKYGRTARKLPKGQQDHHLLFRTLFDPFYEGLDAKQAKELTQWFVENNAALGNVLENLEGVDSDLHQEAWDSIHTWAKDNQIDVKPFTKEQAAQGLSNRRVTKDGKTIIAGGAGGEVIDTGKVIPNLQGPEIPDNINIRKVKGAKFPNLADMPLNQRLVAAKEWLNLIQEPLLEKTASVLEKQDLRYAKADPTFVPKNKAQWLDKWNQGFENAAARAKILADNPNVSAADLDSAEPHLLKDTVKNKISKTLGNITSKTRTADLVAQTVTGVATGNPLQAGVAGGTLAATQVLQSPQVQKRVARQIADLVAKRGAKTAAKFMPGLDIVISGKESWDYLRQGRLDQAGIAALSGAIGWVPVIGDGASAALDLTNTGIDIARLDFNQQGDAKKKKIDTDIPEVPNRQALKTISRVF